MYDDLSEVFDDYCGELVASLDENLSLIIYSPELFRYIINPDTVKPKKKPYKGGLPYRILRIRSTTNTGRHLWEARKSIVLFPICG